MESHSKQASTCIFVAHFNMCPSPLFNLPNLKYDIMGSNVNIRNLGSIIYVKEHASTWAHNRFGPNWVGPTNLDPGSFSNRAQKKIKQKKSKFA